MRLKLSKYNFLKSKIKALSNVNETRALLGLLNYYCRPDDPDPELTEKEIKT